MYRIIPLLALLFVTHSSLAEELKPLTNVPYGDHPRQVLPWIQEYSPIEHVSKDDPPIAMFYGGEVPVVGSSPKDPTHSGVMGIKLEERLNKAGVDVVLIHPGSKHEKYRSSADYLIQRLLE